MLRKTKTKEPTTSSLFIRGPTQKKEMNELKKWIMKQKQNNWFMNSEVKELMEEKFVFEWDGVKTYNQSFRNLNSFMNSMEEAAH